MTYTAGYAGRTVDELDQLAEKLNAIVIDIRYSPRSRRPEWSRKRLIERFGERYYHLPEWGNVNYNRPTEPIKINDLKEGSFRLPKIMKANPGMNVILLCYCGDREICHRKTVATLVWMGNGVQEVDWGVIE